MSDETTTSAAPESFSDVGSAYRWAMEQGSKQPEPEANSPAESAEPATADTRSAVEADTAQPEEAATSETQETAPAEQPPRELPRSWSKDRAEVWSKLDPAVQDILIEQDRQASAEVRRVQNEAAEARKAAEATRTQAENRVQVGERVQTLQRELDELSFVNNMQFGDIKSQADLDKLSSEQLRLADSDPVMAGKIGAFLTAWQTHQHKMHAKANELQQAKGLQDTETQSKWAAHVQEEDAKFEGSLSDSDKASLAEMRKEAPAFLQKLGFTQSELNELAAGKSKLSIYDHRMQALIRNSMRLEKLEAAAAKAKTAPVPPVTRPGARTSGGNASALQAATQAFNLNPNPKTAAALAMARREAATRH